MTRANDWRALDALWVGLLALFVAAGVRTAPFHGDESTINMMSHDWHTIITGRVADLFYRDPPLDDPSRQDLRLLNGTLTGFGIGALWWSAGFQVSDLSTQWDWGADFAYNRDNGHIPGPCMLFVSRLWGAWCTALSAALVFATARRMMNRSGAWVAAYIYATLPVVVLNGRRISFEGVTLLAETLLIFVAVLTVQHIARKTMTIGGWLWFGAVCGLALAAKHNLLIVMSVTVLLVLASPYLFVPPQRLTTRGTLRREFPRTLRALLIVGIVTCVVFLALNPAWWSAPLRVPGEVFRLRADLLNGQMAAFGSYPSSTGGIVQRIAALTALPLGAPQYYEAGDQWAVWIGDQIARYEAAWFGPLPLRGIHLPAWSLIFPLIGLLWPPYRVSIQVMRAMAAGVALALLALTPVPWQRYYLPLAPFWAILYAAGIAAVVSFVVRRVRRSPRVEQS
jgi:4-amino-4-deoxy-L-arabinose transferase-like glycosyltransferase